MGGNVRKKEQAAVWIQELETLFLFLLLFLFVVVVLLLFFYFVSFLTCLLGVGALLSRSTVFCRICSFPCNHGCTNSISYQTKNNIFPLGHSRFSISISCNIGQRFDNADT